MIPTLQSPTHGCRLRHLSALAALSHTHTARGNLYISIVSFYSFFVICLKSALKMILYHHFKSRFLFCHCRASIINRQDIFCTVSCLLIIQLSFLLSSRNIKEISDIHLLSFSIHTFYFPPTAYLLAYKKVHLTHRDYQA